jgi:deoxyribonuclease II
VLWNDQFDGDPIHTQESPTGHSKGMLAWNADGNGVVMQVSTPSWPGSGSADHPRKTDGNTLGCVKDNDVLVSQHFFSLRLTKDDVVNVAKGLVNASVATDPTNPQIVNNGGPSEIQAVVQTLGKHSPSKSPMDVMLSTGVRFLSKPSKLEVPPWQMVSAVLGGEPLRVASWYTLPEIPSTTAATAMGCWDASLGKPGDVEIATSGTWNGTPIGLLGMPEPDGNHAKVGVSTGTHSWAIFGDLNQQGSIEGKCDSSQNGRGGTFYVVENANLAKSVTELLKGDRAPQQ